ncbi:MAG: hypothetical protein HGA96_05080 [Desulfobulbaceae bacterium]|nr:hypothetical protein [Desulfobulbaceae bacterium]
MKPIWKSIFAVATLPFRLAIVISRRPSNGKERLAGRYTRPDKMVDIESATNCLIG